MLPLDQACSFGSIRLLDRIWESSDPKVDQDAGWSLCQHLRADTHYYRCQFTKSLRAAVKLGELEIVKWVLHHFVGCTAGEEVVEETASCGRLEILQYLLDYSRYRDQEADGINTILWGGDDIANAIQGGHSDVARWLHENTPDSRRNLHHAMGLTVHSGDRSLVQWFLDVVYETERLLPPPSMNDAAAGGHMEILQWIFEEGYTECSDNALIGAAKSGRLDMVKWLVEKGITNGAREAVQVACGGGHIEIVQWLLERDWVPYPHFAMNCAIHQGHLDIVKYLCATGISYRPSRMMIDAASYGHLHVVKWLLETFADESVCLFPTVDPFRVGPSNHSAMDRAAHNGHLHVLTFLHSLAVSMQEEGKSGGPTCSNWALEAAATMGHFEILKWLRNTYPHLTFPSSTTSMAARNGNLEILQWLHQQNKVEWPTDVMDAAAENGHLVVLKWLQENRTEGCTTDAMNYAARNGHLDVVRWLQLNRTEGCTSGAMDFAVDRGHFEVLLFLRANRTEGCTAAAKIFAREHRQRHILEWLEEQYPYFSM